MTSQEDFMTIHPKNPHLALNKRRLIKETSGVISRVVERFFVVDDFMLIYFSNENEKNFTKHIQLEGSSFLVESKDNAKQSKYKWHDKTQSHRVEINLLSRNNKPIFFYTNDLNEAKTLAARIKKASEKKQGDLSRFIHLISLIDSISRFRHAWKIVDKVYDQRIMKMVSFQIMGINLIELANHFKLQRRRLMNFWQNQVLRRDKKPVLKSTFKYGQIHRNTVKNAGTFKTSLLTRSLLKKLVNTFQTRRLQRHQLIQQKLNQFLGKEENGFNTDGMVIHYYKDGKLNNTKAIGTSRLRIDGHKFLQIEKAGDSSKFHNDEYYFEKNVPMRYALEDIGCIATDYFNRPKGEKSPYNVRIYSKMVKEVFRKNEVGTMAPYELDYDTPIRYTKNMTVVVIHAIEVPYLFAKRFHQQGDLRVRIRQARTKEAMSSKFYVNSMPFRIILPPKQNKGDNVRIDCENYRFYIDKLNQSNLQEMFKLNVVLLRNSVPMTPLEKEFLFQEEFKSRENFQHTLGENLKSNISGYNKLPFIVHFSIQFQSSENYQMPMSLEGNRILINRYVILDKKKPYRVAQINTDGTLDLKNLTTNEELKKVPIDRISLIEKQGVSLYDMNNLPYPIKNSEYEWVVEFQSQNERLLNIISSGTQDRMMQKSYDQRKYREFLKDKDIQGKLKIAIMKANILNNRVIQNPQVIMQMKFKQEEEKKGELVSSSQVQIDKTFTTDATIDSSEPTWTNFENPCGKLFDLGEFSKDPKKCPQLIFQLVNAKNQNLFGSASIDLIDLIDIQNPLKEKSLILEGASGYSFLTIQTLFIAKKKSRIKFQIKEDLSYFQFPEQYAHFKYLLRQRVHDQFNYCVPLSKFNPNHLEQLIRSAIVINQHGAQVVVKYASPLLANSNDEPDTSSTPWFVQHKNAFCSFEEELAQALKLSNQQRPDFEETILTFKYIWKKKTFFPEQDSYMTLQLKNWNKFLENLQQDSNCLIIESEGVQLPDTQRDYSFFLENIDQKSSIFKFRYPNQSGVQMKNWFSGGDPKYIKFIDTHKNQEIQLLFRNLWDNQNSQLYADLYYLILAGIPPTLRTYIWKDLLNIPIIQYEETKLFQKTHNMQFDSKKSLYQNYLEFSNKEDCLAFRQIDQDVMNYQFPKYYRENDEFGERLMLLNQEKRKMRNILKVQVMWSRDKKFENKLISYSYNVGILSILQRLLTISSEEDSFWILNRIIKAIPRLFSTEISCLQGGRLSAMRYEMTGFKAVLRQNLPQVCDKFKILGYPVEHLIYDSITSFYANFFSSDVLLRLWDLIIFNLSNKERQDRKRAIWFILAPAFLVIREKQHQINEAESIQQIVDIYNNGSSLSYSPKWVINEVKNLIKSVFVIGGAKQEQQKKLSEKSDNKFKSMLGDIYSKVNQEDQALKLEETFQSYQADLTLIFNTIEKENSEINNLIETSQQKNKDFLDYKKWRTHIMAKFKKIALKNSDSIEDDLYEYDEPDLSRENLDLSKVNLVLHQLTSVGNLKSFTIRTCYGKLDQDRTFNTIEEYFTENAHKTLKTQEFHIFDYLKGYNHIQIQLLDALNDNQLTCELLIDLRNINANRFIKKWFLMKNESSQVQESENTFRFPFPQIEISFYLQTHTESQHNQMMQARNKTMSQFVNSIKRKLPDRIDVFNKKTEQEFIKLMQSDFTRIINEEFRSLRSFLPIDIAKNTINDNFNFVNDSDFGEISLKNLIYLVEQCFFNEWTPHIENVYKLFIKENQDTQPKGDEQYFTQQQERAITTRVSNFFTTFKKQLGSPQQSPTRHESLPLKFGFA